MSSHYTHCYEFKIYFCFLVNFPWLVPFVRLFVQQSSFGLGWRHMETIAKKLVSEQHSQGIGGKVRMYSYAVTFCQS